MTCQVSQKPCPICRKMMFVIGKNNNGGTLTSCGHRYKFKRTRSEKMLDRRYIKRPWGLEIIK